MILLVLALALALVGLLRAARAQSRRCAARLVERSPGWAATASTARRGPQAEPSRRGWRPGSTAWPAGSARFAGRYFGSEREEALRRELRSAALYSLTPRKFLGYRLLAAVALPAAVAVARRLRGLSGCHARARLRDRRAGRLAGAARPRPPPRADPARPIDFRDAGAVDLLVTTIEAGVGFGGTLQLAAQRMHGELCDELRLALQEQDMGLLDRGRALEHARARATPSRCGRSCGRSCRASSSASRSGRSCATSRSRCARSGARRPRSGPRRRRRRCSSRSPS